MRPLRSVSVLMPTWQGMEFLDRVLGALAKQRFDRPWDFLAVDSGSNDGTWEALERHAATFPVPLRRERIDKVEFDHGDTRNLLAARSSGDLLVYLTQDAIPSDERWLHKLVANFDDERVGAAYCRNVPRPDARRLTQLFSAGDLGYQPGRREVRLPDPATYAAMSSHQKRVLYNFNDVASAVRRELWERHPFPRTWFGEDVLMARAVLEAGFTVVYDDEATVEHSHDYDERETFERAKIDARFNAEWLDRICVASASDARVLTERLLEADRAVLAASGVTGDEMRSSVVEAAKLRAAAFQGLYEGGRTDARRPSTRMLERTQLSILYVVHGFPPDTWAGTEIYTFNVASEMQRRGHRVTVLARVPAATSVEAGGPPDFSIAESEFQGLRVLRMTNRIAHRSLADSYRDERAEAAFARVLERERPDVVHFQHLIHLSAGLVEVARSRGVATMLTVHDYWALCARVQLIRPDGVRCEENQGAGCILCVKNTALERIPAAKAAGKLFGGAGELAATLVGQHEYADLMERHRFVPAAYAAADLRASPSRFLRQKLVESGAFDPHAFVYSDNGMRTDHLRAIEKTRDAQGRVRFGFVGSLVWYKGGEVMLRAMQRLAGSRAVLNVYGDFKPEADEHHAALKALAGENVSFRGRFDNAKLSEVHAEIDVLLVPSVWFENSPITIHEAWMTRTPVIASDIGGMKEYVRDGVDGLHFATGDDADLAAKMRRFLDEPDLLERLSRDFPQPKTIQDDAAATEFRYRQLACIVRAGAAPAGPRMLLERTGIETCSRHGGAEQQGADMLLLRAGARAAAEYDLEGSGGGPRIVRVEQFALGVERDLVLGARVLVDGVQVGEFPAFRSNGSDGVRAHDLALEIASSARKLRIEPLASAGGETYARLKRVLVIHPGANA